MGGLINFSSPTIPRRSWPDPGARATQPRTYKKGGEGGGSAPLLRLQVFSPPDAARYIAETIAGLPVTDVFCFERIGAMDDALVDRHVELLTDALPSCLEAELRAAAPHWLNAPGVGSASAMLIKQAFGLYRCARGA